MMRRIWPLALAMVVAPCAAQRSGSIDELIGMGNLRGAENAARMGGDSTAAWLGEVLIARGKLTEAESVLVAVSAGGGIGSRRAVANLAELAERRGNYAEMTRWAEPLARDWQNRTGNWSADDDIAAGRVLRLLGRSNPELVRAALAAFDAATVANPAMVEPELRAADLLLEKYNAPDAVAGYNRVLARRKNDIRAILGRARAASFSGSTSSIGQVRAALEIAPESVDALLLLAQLQLESEQYDSSWAAVNSAQTIDSNRVDLWAARASLYWLAGDSVGFATAESRASQLNSKPANFYAAVAEAAGRHRRYESAVELARMAVAADSTSVFALGTLGNNLLRTGKIPEGQRVIARAFELDPFNLWHKNTLDLLDQLATFDTVKTKRFEIVATAEDAPILGNVLSPLLERAYDSLASRYGNCASLPIRIELYDRHADFSVRTIGLAGLGALGVSFGPLLVMDAPDARPPGEFNLGSTAWHELAHTFTLCLSANKVPRWFSEGLSVLEERRARPGWGATASLQFIHALATDSLLPIGQLNDGFVRPDSPGRVGLSYYQASLVSEFLEQRFGIEGIRAMLRGYADGQTTDTVIARVSGGTSEQFDSTFFGWLNQRFAEPLKYVAAGDIVVFGDPMRAAVVLMEAGDTAAAIPRLREAQSRFKEYGGEDGPALPLAMALWSTGKRADALQTLSEVTGRDETALTANRLEASWRIEVADTAGATEALERALWIAPYDRELWTQKAQLLEATARYQEEVVARRAIVQLKPADPIVAGTDLAAALIKNNQPTDARRELLRVLERAPGYERAQQLLLELRRPTSQGVQ